MIEYKVKVFTAGKEYHWYNLKGERHREDGPAIDEITYKAWWINGLRHREDGPAIEWGSRKEYWVKGIKLSEKEFNNRNKSCDGTIVEAGGKKYKLVEIGND